MKAFRFIAIALAASLATPAAAQQGVDTETFIKAVGERDAAKALELLEKHGTVVLNGRSFRGDTALIRAIEDRNDQWIGYMISKGADPNISSADGETPLLAATRIGYVDAVTTLLRSGADVNGANRRGETPLIIAVQMRQTPIVRLLLAEGANPDKADSAAGYSAREYAKRDSRSPQILRMIEAADTKKSAPATAAIAN